MLGFSISPFDYPTIANHPLPDPKKVDVPEANVVQVKLYTSGNNESISRWTPWVVCPSAIDETCKKQAQQLATFLNAHEYFRYSNSVKAGREITSVKSHTSVHSELHPLPSWQKMEVKQGLVRSWQNRVGEDLTQQIDPDSIGFNPHQILMKDLEGGNELWQRYFNTHHWTPYLRDLVDTVHKQASTEEAQIQCFAAIVLGKDDEPKNRVSYVSACKTLLSKDKERNKAAARRSKAKNHGGEAPLNPTEEANSHSPTQHVVPGNPVGEGAPSPVPEQAPTLYPPGTPFLEFHSARATTALSAPSSIIPSFLIPADVDPTFPHDLDDVFHGEVGTENLRRLTEQDLDTLLGADGSGTLPGMSSRVKLRWHQKCFVLFALVRFFQETQCHPWGGIALFDAPGLGKTASTLGLHSMLISQLNYQRGKGQTSKISGILETRPWCQGLDIIPDHPSVLVVLDSTLYQWESEAQRFLKPGLVEVAIYSRESRQEILRKMMGPGAGRLLVIVSKSKLVSAFVQVFGQGPNPQDDGHFIPKAGTDGDLFKPKLLCVYVDEAQNYRNPNSTHDALRQLCTQACIRLVLTATPVPTRLENLLYIARAIGMNGFSGSGGLSCITEIENEMNKIRRSAHLDGSSMSSLYSEASWSQVQPLVSRIKSTLSDSILRRTTSSRDVDGSVLIPLPELKLQRVPIQLAEHEREAMQATHGWWADSTNKDEKARKFEAFQTTTRRSLLHVVHGAKPGQAPNADNGFYSFPTANAPDPFPSSKLTWTTQKINEIFKEDLAKKLPEEARRKILIVLEWSGMIPIIEATFNAAGITASFIDGSMSSNKRGILLQQLNELGSHPDSRGRPSWVCVISRTIAVGVNCQRASCIITLDVFWSYADFDQAIARVLRMGQERVVEAFLLFGQGTIEEEMYDLAMSKAKVMKSLVNGGRDEGILQYLAIPTESRQGEDPTDGDGLPHTPARPLAVDGYDSDISTVLLRSVRRLRPEANDDGRPGVYSFGPPSSPTPFVNAPINDYMTPLASQAPISPPILSFSLPGQPASISLNSGFSTSEGTSSNATNALQRSPNASTMPALGVQSLDQDCQRHSSQSTVVPNRPSPGHTPEFKFGPSNGSVVDPSPGSPAPTPPGQFSSRSDMLSIEQSMLQQDVPNAYHLGRMDDGDQHYPETHKVKQIHAEHLHGGHHAEKPSPASGGQSIPFYGPKTFWRLTQQKIRENALPRKRKASTMSPVITTVCGAGDRGSEVAQTPQGGTDKPQGNLSEASPSKRSPLSPPAKRHSETARITVSTELSGDRTGGVDLVANGNRGLKPIVDEWPEGLKKLPSGKSLKGIPKSTPTPQIVSDPCRNRKGSDGSPNAGATQTLGDNPDSPEQGDKWHHEGSVAQVSPGGKPNQVLSPLEKLIPRRLEERLARYPPKTGLSDFGSSYSKPDHSFKDGNRAHQAFQLHNPFWPPNRQSSNGLDNPGLVSLPWKSSDMKMQEELGEDNLEPRTDASYSSMLPFGTLNLNAVREGIGSRSHSHSHSLKNGNRGRQAPQLPESLFPPGRQSPGKLDNMGLSNLPLGGSDMEMLEELREDNLELQSNRARQAPEHPFPPGRQLPGELDSKELSDLANGGSDTEMHEVLGEDDLEPRSNASYLSSPRFGALKVNVGASSHSHPRKDGNRARPTPQLPEPPFPPGRQSPNELDDAELSELPRGGSNIEIHEELGDDNVEPQSDSSYLSSPRFGTLKVNVGASSHSHSRSDRASNLSETVSKAYRSAKGRFSEGSEAGPVLAELDRTTNERTATRRRGGSEALSRSRGSTKSGQRLSQIEMQRFTDRQKLPSKVPKNNQPNQGKAGRSSQLNSSNGQAGRRHGPTEEHSEVESSSEEDSGSSSNYEPGSDDDMEGSTDRSSSDDNRRKAKEKETETSSRKRKRGSRVQEAAGQGSTKRAPPLWNASPRGPQQASSSARGARTPAQPDRIADPHQSLFQAVAKASWMGMHTLGKTNAEANKAREEEQLRKRMKTAKSHRGALNVPS